MSKVHIVIADSDEGYLRSIELKFINELGYDMELELITERTYFDKYFSVPRSIDVLIISQEFYSSDILKHTIKNFFVLSDNYENFPEVPSVHSIYKYSSVKNIYNEIAYSCALSAQAGEMPKKETKIIMVYSPLGGSGKTTVALGLSGVLSASHYRTLYIDAEYLQTFHKWMKNRDCLPVEVGKELLNDKADLYTCLKPYIRYEQFDYIPPFHGSIAAYALDETLYLRLIETIKATGDYDFIVIDTDKTLNEKKFSLIKMSDRVMIIQRQTEKDVFDMHVLMDNINATDAEKYVVVCNEYSAEEYAGILEQLDYNVGGYVTHCEYKDIATLDDLKKIEGMSKLLYVI